MTDLNTSPVRGVVRRLVRPVVLAVVPAVVLAPAVVLSLAGPALADAPEQWADPDPVSGLHAMLILVAIPLALFVGISLLVYVPSMAHGERYTPGLAWRSENEWFGGPRGGVGAADNAEPRALEADLEGGTEGDRGGARARW